MTTTRQRRRTSPAGTEPTDEGPSLRAVTFGPGGPEPQNLLSRRQQQLLLNISTRLHLPARMFLFREESQAQWVFIVESGVLKSFRDMPSGKRRVLAFMFAHDLMGLAERGLYVNTAQTITPATLYRIRIDDLSEALRADPDLDMQFLCKVTHELRKSLRQTVTVSRRDAVGRVAMFLHMLEHHSDPLKAAFINIPMSRTDAANYLGLSLEAVSRATRSLEKDGIVSFIGLHSARVLDRPKFDRIAATL